MALVIDGVLSAAALRRASTPSEFTDGQERNAAVSEVALQPGRAHGWVAGRSLRTVVLDWSEGRLRGGCSCRESRGDTLCRHVVALGLAALTGARTQVRPPTRETGTTPGGQSPQQLSPVEQWLGTLALTQLQDLVLEVAPSAPTRPACSRPRRPSPSARPTP